MSDLEHAREWLEPFDPERTAELIAAATDVCVVLDAHGVVRDTTCRSEDIDPELCRRWRGRPFLDAVTPESRGKVVQLLDTARAGAGPTRPRQVNHASATAADLPVAYRAVLAPDGHHVIALGRSVAAVAALQQRLVESQQTVERDYWQLRQMETRYRLLFDRSGDGLLVLDADTRRILEANPTARRLLAPQGESVVGEVFPVGFHDGDSRTLTALLAEARTSGHSGSVLVHPAGTARQCSASASMLRERQNASILLQLVRGDAPAQASEPRPVTQLELQWLDAVAQAPDGLVLASASGEITDANSAFLELSQLATLQQARGRRLDEWLGERGIDFALMARQLRERGQVRLLHTRLWGEYEGSTEVEVSATRLEQSETSALFIRDVARRLEPAGAPGGATTPTSVEQLKALVGRAPLKEIVRESTDLIERLAIEAALELTSGNRASAAELLGLSRQSLYVKLRKFGVGADGES